MSEQHSHSFSLDMLNNFCFHVYAQKALSREGNNGLENYKNGKTREIHKNSIFILIL